MFGIRYDLINNLSTLQHVLPILIQCGFTNYFQGKYDVEILIIFYMLYCKSMATPMDTNMKLLFDETSELVDMTQYKHIICNTPVLTPFALNVFDVYIVINHGVELQ